MTDTYEVERYVERAKGVAWGWHLVLTTTGFVEATARLIDERKSGASVRLTVR